MRATENSINLVSWNIKSGGFDGYDSISRLPERGEAIKGEVFRLHSELGIDTVCLVDAYRWMNIYGGDQGVANHLNYKNARITPVGDSRIDPNILYWL